MGLSGADYKPKLLSFYRKIACVSAAEIAKTDLKPLRERERERERERGGANKEGGRVTREMKLLLPQRKCFPKVFLKSKKTKNILKSNHSSRFESDKSENRD